MAGNTVGSAGRTETEVTMQLSRIYSTPGVTQYEVIVDGTPVARIRRVPHVASKQKLHHWSHLCWQIERSGQTFGCYEQRHEVMSALSTMMAQDLR